MKIIGVELKSPSSRELLIVCLFVGGIAAIGLCLNYFRVLDAEMVFPIVMAASLGVVSNAFGVSISRHGWRALVILGFLAVVLAGAFQALGL